MFHMLASRPPCLALAPRLLSVADGLLMTITSGSIQVLGKHFDISGYSASYGFSGYFDHDHHAGLQLFASPQDAEFDVHIEGDARIDSFFVISGAITAFEHDTMTY
jgi:hypothetical protein